MRHSAGSFAVRRRRAASATGRELPASLSLLADKSLGLCAAFHFVRDSRRPPGPGGNGQARVGVGRISNMATADMLWRLRTGAYPGNVRLWRCMEAKV